MITNKIERKMKDQKKEKIAVLTIRGEFESEEEHESEWSLRNQWRMQQGMRIEIDLRWQSWIAIQI